MSTRQSRHEIRHSGLIIYISTRKPFCSHKYAFRRINNLIELALENLALRITRPGPSYRNFAVCAALESEPK